MISGRKRRTAEEARELVLNVAGQRLAEQGLDGLSITGVAKQAGISHATLLHHFGSSTGMRDALAEKMTAELVRDLTQALRQQVPPALLLGDLFKAMSERGHAKLLAWRMVDDSRTPMASEEAQSLFASLLETTQDILGYDDIESVRHAVMLVAAAALGQAVAGELLPALLGSGADGGEDFAGWLADLLVAGARTGAA